MAGGRIPRKCSIAEGRFLPEALRRGLTVKDTARPEAATKGVPERTLSRPFVHVHVLVHVLVHDQVRQIVYVYRFAVNVNVNVYVYDWHSCVPCEELRGK